ncbi:phosducin-like protein isoform X2 [Hyalella azteca]|uniref:Phosducin-like protein isoform X1 n=1 Tax=Hyalella azteca TaxID=294128 RepID=A0A8B7P0G6_HYAAZ|nr:phosducin-like protein isoform X1 [Hyalella azteca]XP_018019503.1 phosducin-like protein isoform X2 [Hyalella azteca]
MATLEDRLLGEKLQYYCSSSEDEQSSPEDDDKVDEDQGASGSNKILQDAAIDCGSKELQPWEGSSTNTGPKGVLKDWRNYKQMETEKRKEKEKERIQLAKKLALTCRSHLEDEKAEAAQNEDKDDVDSLLDAAVLESYIAQRMQEMMEQAKLNCSVKFGRVVHLKSTEEFLKAVDEEDKKVTVIVHIYRKDAAGCDAVSGCLACLAQDYEHVKFCELSATTAGLSSKFVVNGVPALLVYRGGLMISNFVRLTDSLGDDFYATDLESFLVEHGSLPDRTLVPASCIRSSAADAGDDSDVSLDD